MRVTQFVSAFLIFAVAFASQLAIANETSADAVVDLNAVSVVRSAYPVAVATACSNFDGAIAPTQTATFQSPDAEVVRKILTAISPDHGRPLFLAAPDVAMWWVRTLGAVSAQSIGVAIHESNHAIDAALTRCNRGFATYRLRNKTYITDHKFGDTPAYGIISLTLPASLKKSQPGSRYPQYIERNGSHPRSDFSILLDEFVAYTGAAPFDVAVAQSKQFAWLVNPEVTGLDVNIGGVADFMIYTLSYIKALRSDYPAAYATLKQQSRTIGLLQATWTAAEASLADAFIFTKNAGQGGVLMVLAEALSYAYADEFLAELDLLGISHMPRSYWARTYLQVGQ